MNKRIVWNYLGRILALESICMIPALLIALFKHEKQAFTAFLAAMLLQACVGLLLNTIKVKSKTLYAREGIAIVALSWVVISIFGAIPMCLSGAIPSYIDSLFEIISGFSTTGSTILKDIEALPMSALYWRSFTHWLGGMGVLVFILALAPSQNGSGMSLHILRAESPGPDVGKLASRTHSTARILYLMYFVLTVLELFFLLIGGMPFFDALTTSLGTAGTGGFSIKNAGMAAYSTFCQGVVSVFMMLFGINFGMYFLLLVGDIKGVLKNTELRVYFGMITIATVAITFFVKNEFSSIFMAFHHSFFQVVSLITTSGYATADFNMWPSVVHAILLCLMAVGACAGSTGGGFKISRVIILWKNAKNEMKRVIHPHSVSVMTVDGRPVEKTTVERCCAYLFLYVVAIAFSTILISVDGFGFVTNFSAVLSCVNNIGPGIESVGPYDNFANFSVFSKLVLMFDMLFGRLEIYPMLLFFAPKTWSKR